VGEIERQRGLGMVDKNQYIKMFSNLLNEHYLSIGETNRARPASHYFIDGFLTATKSVGRDGLH